MYIREPATTIEEDAPDTITDFEAKFKAGNCKTSGKGNELVQASSLATTQRMKRLQQQKQAKEKEVEQKSSISNKKRKVIQITSSPDKMIG